MRIGLGLCVSIALFSFACSDGAPRPLKNGNALTCAAGEYACSGGSKCVPSSAICNGMTGECPLNDDEPPRCQQARSACQPNQFDCGGNACIPENQRCDGTMQCANNADEANCALGSNSPDTLGCSTRNPPEILCSAQAPGQMVCAKDTCADGKTCTNDQNLCPKPTACPANAQYRCPGDSRKAQQCTSDSTLASCGLPAPVNECPNPTMFRCSDGDCYYFVCNNTCHLLPCN